MRSVCPGCTQIYKTIFRVTVLEMITTQPCIAAVCTHTGRSTAKPASLPTFDGDHMDLQGGLTKKHDIKGFYTDLLGMIDSLA